MRAAKIVDGDLVELSDFTSEFLTGNEEALQYVGNLLKFTLGEFFIEPLEGVDTFRILESKTDVRLLTRTEFIKAFNNDNRITRIIRIAVDNVDNQTRAADISFKIEMDSSIILDESLQIKPELKIG